MAGRKPKPTAVKKLEGNPGKRKLNTKEPVPAKGMPACSDWLMPEAKKEWERLAKLMNQMTPAASTSDSYLQFQPKVSAADILYQFQMSSQQK